jgi:tRNA(Ile)-lysidine synthase TilS/MesJ
VYAKILKVVTTQDIFSPKAMERASSICTGCINLIRFACFQIAIEKHIPFVVFGLSPGQAPESTAVVKMNPSMMRRMQDAIFNPLYRHLGDEIRPCFLSEEHFAEENNFPYIINPLAFVDYSEEKMIRNAEQYGWVRPDDTDSNSTNCRLNLLAIELHRERFGFHPYSSELAEFVRDGHLDRVTALGRIEESADSRAVEALKRELDL